MGPFCYILNVLVYRISYILRFLSKEAWFYTNVKKMLNLYKLKSYNTKPISDGLMSLFQPLVADLERHEIYLYGISAFYLLKHKCI